MKLSPYSFKAWTIAQVTDESHARFGQSGIVSAFKRDEGRNITGVEIAFAPYNDPKEQVWFTPDQLTHVVD